MKASRLKDQFRIDMDDLVEPFLWSDGDIALYMDDAQKMFCRLTGGLRDASSTLCTVDIDIDEPFSPIDPRILKIVRIQRDSDGKKLDLVNFEDIDAVGIRLDNQTGPVDRAVIGMEENKLRWVRVPAAADTASMIVERLPLNTITDQFNKPLEIEEQHHLALLLWMAARAYGKQDSDTYNAAKSADKEAKFIAYCEQAKLEIQRKRHKTRIIGYGGI